MLNTYHLTFLFEAITPITHMMGNSGNESLINRENLIQDGEIKNIPVLSGNAMRHVLLRVPGADYLVNELNLNGKLSIPQVNFLYHGGSLSKSSQTENTKKIVELQALFPLLRLLGGCLPTQIMHGSLIVTRGILVCQENMEILNQFLPEDYQLANHHLFSYQNFVSQYQYTRGDTAKTEPEKIKESIEIDAKRKSELMIYSGECIMPGSLFLSKMILQNVSEIELGALLKSIQIWSENKSSIGGQIAKGHGRLKIALLNNLEIDNLINQYEEHVRTNIEQEIKWIGDNIV